MIEDMKFKIRKLQNAAQVAKEIVELSEEEQLMLAVIIHRSKIKVMDLLDEWFYDIKSIFDRLPSDEDLKYKAKELTKEYKLAKENETKDESGKQTDDEVSETSTSDSDSENSENENNVHKSHDSEHSINDIDDNNEGSHKGDKDSVNENDEKSATITDGREADEENSQNIKDMNNTNSDTTKENGDQDSVESVDENEV